ncbi:MAG: hypothetical protein SOV54_08275 [Faecalibacterium prausnitzii]|nr:hypothetical protein [Faecalibacterium prausnitzii]MDY2682714.1 hypothetical protein [Faecalibacterium prausnitzii]
MTKWGADVANGGKKGNKVDLRSKDGEGEDAAPLHCPGGPH